MTGQQLCFVALLALCCTSAAGQERLPGEVQLELDREMFLGNGLPSIEQIVAAVRDPEVQPLFGMRFFSGERNHYAPAWSADGEAMICLRSDLNLNTCKLLLFAHLDQRHPMDIYGEFFTFEHMPAWTTESRRQLLFVSNNEEGKQENLHRLTVFDDQLEPDFDQLTTGEGVKVLPSFHSARGKSQFAYRRDADLYHVRFPTEQPSAATESRLGRGQEASFSHDGEYLVVVRLISGGQVLSIRKLETGQEIRLFEAPNRLIRNPTWSPDGKWIAFYMRENTQLEWDLWICPFTRQPTPLQLAANVRVNADFRHVGPAWTPDSRKLWYLQGDKEQGYYALHWSTTDGKETGTVHYPRGVTTATDLAIGPALHQPMLAFSAVKQHARDIYVVVLNHY